MFEIDARRKVEQYNANPRPGTPIGTRYEVYELPRNLIDLIIEQTQYKGNIYIQGCYGILEILPKDYKCLIEL